MNTLAPYVDGATTWPDNPCTSGTRYASSFAANPGGVGGSSVTITVDGLNPRVYYRFCVRAVDAAGNESADLNPTSMIPTSTLDTQAPVLMVSRGSAGSSMVVNIKLRPSGMWLRIALLLFNITDLKFGLTMQTQMPLPIQHLFTDLQ